MALVIFTDGAALGNPGPMGIGVVVFRGGTRVKEICEYAGQGTNNVAEYTAVMRALEFAREKGEKEIHIKSDSQLVIRQLNGEYKARDPKLKALKRKIDELCFGMAVRFEHIPREQNEDADELSKAAAKKGKKKEGVQKKLNSFSEPFLKPL